MQHNKSAPATSPLDDPRFFEDLDLSELAWNGKRVVGTKHNLRDARAYVRNDIPGAPVPDGRSPNEPVSIELVRGSDGHGGDNWVVLVDGLQCQLKRADGRTSGPYKCTLPPGVSRKAKLSSETKVRPVAIGVRLEDEARAPLVCQAKVFQVLKTDERYLQEPNTDTEPSQIGNTIELKPYRVNDITATSVVLPYPFWAPAQSTLGLLCLKAVNAWEHKKRHLMAHNVYSTVYNGVVNVMNASSLIAYNNINQSRTIDQIAENLSTYSANLSNELLSETREERDASKLKEFKTRLTSDKPYRIPNLKPETPQARPTKEEQSYAIGGKDKSVPKELANMFKTITILAKNVNEEMVRRRENGEVVTLSKKLGVLRHFIALQRDTTLAALFDALFSTDTHPAAQAYLHSVLVQGDDDDVGFPIKKSWTVEESHSKKDGNNNDEEYTVKLAPDSKFKHMSAKQKQTFYEDIVTKAVQSFEDDLQRSTATDKPDQSYKPDYMLTYDRVPVTHRTRTTLRTSFLVEVIDYDEKDNFVIEFESMQEDGVVAHCVYSQFVDDIKEFDIRAQELVDALFQLHMDDYSITETLEEHIADLSRMLKKLQLLSDKEDITDSTVQARHVWDMAKVLPAEVKGVFKRTSSNAPFKFDVSSLEDRVIELRIMCRFILPIWPPQENSLYESSTLVYNKENGEEGDDMYSKKQEIEKIEKYIEKYERYLANEEADARRKTKDQIGDKLAVFDQSAYNGAHTTLLRRTLPHIVKTGSLPVVHFETYADMDPPEEYYPVEKEGFRISFFRPSSILQRDTFGKASVAAASSYIALAFSLYATRVLANTAGKLAGIERYEALAQQFIFQLLNSKTTVAMASGRASQVMQKLLMSATITAALSDTLFRNLIGGQQFTQNLALAFATLPTVYNAGSQILYAFNQRYRRNDELTKTLRLHRRKVRSKPVASAVASANEAMRCCMLKIKTAKQKHGVVEDISLLNTLEMSTRFLLYEYYEINTSVEQELHTLPGVKDATAWASVPDSNAIKVLPPQDVVDALFEAEYLRGLQLSDAISFTTGTKNILNPTTPSEMAAKAANGEVVRFVARHRRHLRGRHIMESTQETVLKTALRGARILKETYGKKAGVTFVNGDDILWSCARAGISTRLALRHLTVYTSSPQHVDIYSVSKYWRKPRRMMVDAFAEAWVEEAQQFAKSSFNTSLSTISTQLLPVEAVRRYERVKALAASNKTSYYNCVALAAVVSMASYDFLISSDPADSNAVPYKYADSETSGAHTFEDQKLLQKPEAGVQPLEKRMAVWAGRRVSPSESRSTEVGNGAFEITKLLSGLDIHDGTLFFQDGIKYPQIYFCPMGSRVDSLPDKTHFGTELLDSRVVWTSSLLETSNILMNSLVMNSAKSTEQHQGLTIQSVNPKDNTGFARHPLTLSVVSERTVHVALSKLSEDMSFDYECAVENMTLSQAMSSFDPDEELVSKLQRATQRMRTIAFNSDRLMMAKYLVESLDTSSVYLHVKLENADEVVAFAMGICMLETQAKSNVTRYSIEVANGSQMAHDALLNLSSRMEQVASVGCRVCSLAEICLCV